MHQAERELGPGEVGIDRQRLFERQPRHWGVPVEQRGIPDQVEQRCRGGDHHLMRGEQRARGGEVLVLQQGEGTIVDRGGRRCGEGLSPRLLGRLLLVSLLVEHGETVPGGGGEGRIAGGGLIAGFGHRHRRLPVRCHGSRQCAAAGPGGITIGAADGEHETIGPANGESFQGTPRSGWGPGQCRRPARHGESLGRMADPGGEPRQVGERDRIARIDATAERGDQGGVPRTWRRHVSRGESPRGSPGSRPGRASAGTHR